MTEPSVDERPPNADRDHPPFRLRERRLVLLPDLRPPTLEELRWAARERRRRREPPQQRVPVEHEPDAGREPVDVPATITESVPTDVEPSPAEPAEADTTESELAEVGPVEVEPAVIDLVALEEAPAAEPEPAQLRPWRPAVLPGPEADATPEPAWVAEVRAEVAPVVVEPESPAEAEAEPEAPADVAPQPPAEPAPELPDEPADESAPPLVSQVLVVREPVSGEPGGIAVLEDLETQARTVTRLVPLPVEAAAVEPAAPLDDLVEEPADHEVVEEAVEEESRSAPLYWRLLRLRHTRPNGWLRALYFEGSVALGVVLVLAEAASVWTIVVLPLVVAVVVKANDVLAGNLGRVYRQPQRRSRT
ncbi:MAG TPA: hypothetical protein VHE57_09360 [Mycobacteriales bacterium]|nr:hypothetical protein [Mycobacteriales bacterium]